MKFWMTQRHKECFESAFRTMEPFYRNDLESLCIVIGCHYDIPDANVQQAANIMTSLPGITSPVPAKAERIASIAKRWHEGGVVKADNEHWCFEISNEERVFLAHVLDTYSRLLMGQLNMIFEELDIGLPDGSHLLDLWHDVRWNGAGGMREARNLLFPELEGCGWNGGYGISNPHVAFFSRLSYQMAKVLRGGYEFVLPVTDEPLLEVQI